jgi:prolyl-tRNA synthetase
VPLASLGARVPALLDEIQAGLLAQARAFLEANIRDAADYDSFKDIIENKRGFVRAAWCGDEACEARIKTETMATIRVIPLSDEEAKTGAPCAACGAKGQVLAYFARAY